MPGRAEEIVEIAGGEKMGEYGNQNIKRRKLLGSALKLIRVLSRSVQVRGPRAPLFSDRRNRGPKESGSGRSSFSTEQSSDE